MEVNLTGFGPFAYLTVHGLAAMLFGWVMWRNVVASGRAYDEKKVGETNSYGIVAAVMGLISLTNIVFVFVISYHLIEKSLKVWSKSH